MRFKRGHTSDVTVSLFPFLAVLICTMGALVVLLVVISRQAQLQSAEKHREKTAQAATTEAEDDDVGQQRRKIESDIQKVLLDQKIVDEGLSENRQRLGSIEDHSRRLLKKRQRLRLEFAERQRLVSANSDKRRLAERELAILRKQIRQSEEDLKQINANAKSRPPSYAILPYQGKNQTRRRPIYIECRKGRVIVQPEGIELTEDDFLGQMGPAAPLPALLRATREYWAELAGGQLDEEPYPLLIVRPDGTREYNAAQKAIKSWGANYGYELVGQDWKLKYPIADPNLVRIQQQAVFQARQLRRGLIAALKRRRSIEPSYVPARRGGFIRDPSSSGDSSNGGRGTGKNGSSGDHDKDKKSGSKNQQPGDADNRSNRDPDKSPSETNGDRKRAGSGIRSLRSNSGNNTNSNGGPGGPASSGATAPQPPSGGISSLSNSRGKNWALPQAAQSAVGVRRSLRVECYPNRLELVPESRYLPPTVIRFENDTRDSIDEFVTTVQKFISRHWNIAGKGMYWRPDISIYVHRGAEQRFAELEKLLGASGLVITQRTHIARRAVKEYREFRGPRR